MTAKYDVLQLHVIIWKKRRSLFGALHRLNLHITSLLFPSDANQRTANEVDFGKIPLRFLGMAPRVHLGTSIGTSGEASQFFTGFTWTVDLNEKLFLPKPASAASFIPAISRAMVTARNSAVASTSTNIWAPAIVSTPTGTSWPRSPTPRMPISAMGRTTA